MKISMNSWSACFTQLEMITAVATSSTYPKRKGFDTSKAETSSNAFVISNNDEPELMYMIKLEHTARRFKKCRIARQYVPSTAGLFERCSSY